VKKKTVRQQGRPETGRTGESKESGRSKMVFKKRPCRLCRTKTKAVDYRDADFLGKFVSDRGRIIASRITGNCAKHQRMVANAIKRARIAALLPFVKIKEGLPRKRPRTRK